MIDLNQFKKYVNLKQYCTLHVGGNAKYLFEANSIYELQQAYYACKLHNIKCKIIGLGANLLFDDKGYNGAIIVNRTSKTYRRGNNVFVCSGTPISNVISYCYNNNLGGLENLAGIPSTMGGAIVNNLGANGCEIADFVDYVLCLTSNGKVVKLSKNNCQFAYRDSLFKHKEYIILKVKLTLKNCQDKNEIKEKITGAISKKISTQPLNLPSAGSVFKRGNLIPAQIIDQLGLKGFGIGGAMVSTKHAGFIVNTGNATSKDFKDVVQHINNIVKQTYNTTLTTEVEFVDF